MHASLCYRVPFFKQASIYLCTHVFALVLLQLPFSSFFLTLKFSSTCSILKVSSQLLLALIHTTTHLFSRSSSCNTTLLGKRYERAYMGLHTTTKFHTLSLYLCCRLSKQSRAATVLECFLLPLFIYSQNPA